MKQTNTAARQPITNIDIPTTKVLRVAIQEALDKIAEEYGLESIELGNVGVDRHGTYFQGPIVAKVKAELSPAAQAANLNSSKMLGYDRNIVGEEFVQHGIRYKVRGFNFKRPKYPIEAVRLHDDAGMKFGAKHPLPFENKSIGYTKDKNMYANA